MFSKRLLLIVASLLFTPQAHGSTKVEPYVNDIIECTRDIVRYQQGGEVGLRMAINTLNSTLQNLSNKNQLKRLTINCYTRRKALPKRDKVSTEVYLGMLASSERITFAGVDKLLRGFIQPSIDCGKIGTSLSATVGIGLGIKLEGSFCRDSYGYRWLELSPGMNLRLGIGAAISLFKSRDEKRWYWNSPIYPSVASDFEDANMVVVRKSEGSNKDYNGIGVGIGTSNGAGGQLNLSILPLGYDKHYLRSILFNSNKS